MTTRDELLDELLAERAQERPVAAKAETQAPAPPQAQTQAHSAPRGAFALAMFVIGVGLWPVGARYTIDGLAWLAGTVLAFLRIPITIPAVLDWPWYLVLAPLPYICSKVEWQPPLYRHNKRWHLAASDVALTWLIVAVADALTTYWGLRATPADAWPVAYEIGQSVAWSGLIGTILTFLPEWLLRKGWRRLRG